jgi:peptidyl-prolyl cis-trans isomerase SurA
MRLFFGESMKFFTLITLLLINTTLFAKNKDIVLDKIAAIYNDKTITLSQINRIQKNIAARKSIAPMIFSKDKYSKQEILDIIIHEYLVRSYLETIGYVITDQQVEGQIKQTQKRLGLSRKQLLNFLKSNNISFKEYFQLTRHTIEYMSIFLPKVIIPLVSISEQEIKNYYYKKNSDNKTLAFKYTLHDYIFSKKDITKKNLKNINNILSNFQITGNLPSNLQDMQTSLITDVTEDGLMPKIKKALSKTNEGAFSKPVILNNDLHIFFVKKKDLVESEEFQRAKKQIEIELRQKKISSVIKSWYDRERAKHFIKIHL